MTKTIKIKSIISHIQQLHDRDTLSLKFSLTDDKFSLFDNACVFKFLKV